MMRLKEEIENDTLEDIIINELQLSVNNLRTIDNNSETTENQNLYIYSLSVENIIFNFSSQANIGIVESMYSGNKKLKLTNCKLDINIPALRNYKINQINIDELNWIHETTDHVSNIEIKLKTNLFNIDSNSSMDNIYLKDAKEFPNNINVYNGKIIIKPIDFSIMNLIAELEMELGDPLPRNNDNDIILEIIPGTIGNLKIKGLNLY